MSIKTEVDVTTYETRQRNQHRLDVAVSLHQNIGPN